MAKFEVIHSYMVGIHIFMSDTGASLATTVNVDINFRITQKTIDNLLTQVLAKLSRDDPYWEDICKNRSAIVKIISFSRYE